MMPGIVAAQAIAASIGAAASIAALDFVAGTYVVNGSTVAAADIIDHPEWITGSGIEVRTANESTEGDGIVHFIGDVLDLLLTLDWTIVAEYQELAADGATRILVMQDGAITFADFLMIERENSGNGLGITVDDFDDGGSIYRAVNDGAPRAEGIHRIAFTRTSAHLASSVDGDAVVEDATASAGVVAINATIGAGDGEFLFNDLNFRSITIYPAGANSQLPALSA